MLTFKHVTQVIRLEAPYLKKNHKNQFQIIQE
jgi:hypothetical protein